MSEETIQALLEKRAELASQVQQFQSDMYHIDATLRVLGYSPRAKQNGRLFGNGELIRLIGEAERAGATTPAPIVTYLIKAKGLDSADAKLRKRITLSVKECRKRMNARGA